MEHLKKGDIIFNAKQTADLLSAGKTGSYARSYATGTLTSGKTHGYALNTPNLNVTDLGRFVATIKKEISGRAKGDWDDSDSGEEDDSDKMDGLGKVDWIEITIARIERLIENFVRKASNAFSGLNKRLGGTKDAISKITEEINTQSEAAEAYKKAAEDHELDETLKQYVRDGRMDITVHSENNVKLINEYRDLYEKYLDSIDKAEELKIKIAELYKDAFDMIEKDAENRVSMLEHDNNLVQSRMDLADESGLLSSSSVYDSLIETEKEKQVLLKKEREDLQRQLDDAVKSGYIEEGSEAWYEMKLAIAGVDEEIADSATEVKHLENEARKLDWSNFDYLQDRLGTIIDESEFLLDLLDDDKLTDENGLTDKGNAAIGLHSQNYNTYMSQADSYASEIAKIDKELANDPYNTKLIERREQLIASQQKSIISAKKEKDAIKDLVEKGINAEIDSIGKLVDEYKEALDSSKDLYEYQKKIGKQTETIGNIEKQIAAYSGDASDEAIATMQKLNKQLKDAKEDLEDTEYDRYITEQKQMLDELSSDIEEVLNERLDNIDTLLEEAITSADNNSENVMKTIAAAAGAVGYTISDNISKIWSGAGLKAGVDNVISGIYNMVSGMVESGNAVVKKKYATGGLIDYTGIAQVDGSPSKPELVLNQKDTANFIALKNALSGVHLQKSPIEMSGIKDISFALKDAIASEKSANNVNVGGVEINIPIDHVENYEDFFYKMQHDKNFEKMVRSVTTDLVVGGSPLSKYKY